ncbi:regulatory protein RecX [Idiomarina seosinensis]|uniref:Regulatory protein RecX n=1 Tax=Idiomarina seosinensis TaxID=281739 RepID=A0A432ZJF7_9GAMM|nr:regulatory protein RecX [Idiomarina seosinensis]RUO77960.1 OraA [Idiomarina seosinensis]
MSKSSGVSQDASQNSDKQTLKDAAFRLLTRREHSQFELRHKLTQKGWPDADVDELIQELATKGWQSDERFIGSFIREKLMQGQGRIKIVAQATQQRGVDRQLVEAALAEHSVDWQQRCRELHQRKFGERPPVDRKEWSKRVRYLQQRGFSGDQIFAVLGELES